MEARYDEEDREIIEGNLNIEESNLWSTKCIRVVEIIAKESTGCRESKNCKITSNVASKVAVRRRKLKEVERGNCSTK